MATLTSDFVGSIHDYAAFDRIDYPKDPDISPAARRMLTALHDLQTPRRLLHDPGDGAAYKVLPVFDAARRSVGDGLAYHAGDLKPGDGWAHLAPLGWGDVDQIGRLHFQEIEPFRPLVFFGDDSGRPFAAIISPPPPTRRAYWLSQWTLRGRAAVATAACSVEFTPSGHVSGLGVEDVGERLFGATPAEQHRVAMRETVKLANFAGALIFVARNSRIWSVMDERRHFQKFAKLETAR